MLINKSLKTNILVAFSSFFFMHANLFAQDNDNTVDIYANLGYTRLSGFSFSKTEKLFNDFNGVNFGLAALYSLNTNTKFQPVLGGGFNFVNSKNSNSNTGNSDISSYDTSFHYGSLFATGGVKTFISNSFSIYGLANLGYAFSNDFKFEAKSSDSHANFVNSQTTLTAKQL